MLPYPSPFTLRKLACLLYECLIIIAIAMLATLFFIGVWGDASQTPKRFFLQFFLWCVIGTYLVWHWLHGGQTLAMKTWGVALESNSGGDIKPSMALMRYLLVSLFSIISFLWAICDKEGQYLHDRLCGMRLVKR